MLCRLSGSVEHAGMSPPVALTTTARPWLINPTRVCIPSEWLIAGLHVVELDRPWHDTPFMVEGFLVDRQDELQALRLNCQQVHVDLERSEPQSAARLREQLLGMNRTVVTERRTQPRTDGRPSHAARLKFRRLMRQGAGGPVPAGSRWLHKLQQFMLGTTSPSWSPRSEPGDLQVHARRGLLQPDAQQVEHVGEGDFKAGLDEAARTIREAFLIREACLQDAQAKTPCSLPAEALNRIAYRMAEAVIAHPDTLMWCVHADLHARHALTRATSQTASSQALRVAVALLMLGRHMGLDRRSLAELALIGLLADLGKYRIPATLLEKPGMLSPEEFQRVKAHVAHSLDLLQGYEGLPVAVELAIAQHHERLDGSGYPKGLRGDAISLYGRMAAIADCYTALVSPRAYAIAQSPHEAMTNLCEWSGLSFDGPLVEQFTQALSAWPSGTLAELDSGEVAVVMVPARKVGDRMQVLVLLDGDKQPLARPEPRFILGQAQAGDPQPGQTLLGSLPADAYGVRGSSWASAWMAEL